MIKNPKGFAPTRADVAPDAVDDATELAVLRSLVHDLEHEKATLTKGLVTRQRIGFVTGVLAQRYGLQPEAAWRLLAHVSQDSNVKAVRVADILFAVYTGKLASQDMKLAVHISDLLPSGSQAPTEATSPGAVDPAP